MMNETQKEKLNGILSKAGDVCFRRRVVKVIEYLDIQCGDIVLDCGCGEGFYTMVLNELYGNDCTVVSIDMNEQLMKKARGWLKEGSKKNFVLSDCKGLPFKEEAFNKIIFTEVLEHVRDDSAALYALKQVLKKDGTIALTVPNQNYPFLWDPLNKIRETFGLGHFSRRSGFWGGIWAMHIRLYRLDGLLKLLKTSGFSVGEKAMITHYCLPFNHMILYAGKRMGNVIPLPKSLERSMEKFEWDKKPTGFFGKLTAAAMRFIDHVDSKNDKIEQNFKISACCIACKLKKTK